MEGDFASGAGVHDKPLTPIQQAGCDHAPAGQIGTEQKPAA
jgi:hypothetical protein